MLHFVAHREARDLRYCSVVFPSILSTILINNQSEKGTRLVYYPRIKIRHELETCFYMFSGVTHEIVSN